MISYDERLRRFREEKERQEQKKKARQAKAYKDYQAAYRKAHGHKTRQEQARERRIKEERLEKEREVRENERQERLMFIEQRTVSVYNERYIERDARDEDLYLTEDELREAEARGEGKFTDRFWEIIEEARSKRQ